MIGKAHPSKKGVTAVEEIALIPDFANIDHKFANVVFDSDPRPPNTDDDTARAMMSSALVRGMSDDQGQHFLAYFVPTAHTLTRRAVRASELTTDTGAMPERLDGEEYAVTRHYNYQLRDQSRDQQEESYVIMLRDGLAFFSQLANRVKLQRRRLNRECIIMMCVRMVHCRGSAYARCSVARHHPSCGRSGGRG